MRKPLEHGILVHEEIFAKDKERERTRDALDVHVDIALVM